MAVVLQWRIHKLREGGSKIFETTPTFFVKPFLLIATRTLRKPVLVLQLVVYLQYLATANCSFIPKISQPNISGELFFNSVH